MMTYEKMVKTIKDGEDMGDAHSVLPSEEFTNNRAANRRSLLIAAFVSFVVLAIGMQFFA